MNFEHRIKGSHKDEPETQDDADIVWGILAWHLVGVGAGYHSIRYKPVYPV
jgi:hypothetical protein